MGAKKKICVFSGKRGGSGAYLPLLQLLQLDPDYELELILSDMHTSKEFGCTAEEVLEWLPGVRTHLIDMATGQGDAPVIRTKNLSVCLWAAAKILAQTCPDLVMVHGDRGEPRLQGRD